MIFGGLQRSSTIDFPGVLSCVVFTKGCDLDCFYCHNRELIEGGESIMEEEEIFSFLEKRRGLLDGVVISGGEPSYQRGLDGFIRKIKEMGYRVKLDTNGQHLEKIEDLIKQGWIDYVAVDVKALEKDYLSVCGKNGYEKVYQTICFLMGSNVPYELRTTLYPGMTTDMLMELMKGFPPVRLWRLNYFHMPERYREEDKEWLEGAALNAVSLQGSMEMLRKIQPNLEC